MAFLFKLVFISSTLYIRGMFLRIQVDIFRCKPVPRASTSLVPISRNCVKYSYFTVGISYNNFRNLS